MYLCTGARERFFPRGGPTNKKNEILAIFKNFTLKILDSRGGPGPPGPPWSHAPRIPLWVFQVQPRNSEAREPTIFNSFKTFGHTTDI